MWGCACAQRPERASSVVLCHFLPVPLRQDPSSNPCVFAHLSAMVTDVCGNAYTFSK